MIKTLTITASMEERWIPTFQRFLKELEKNGNIGHSEIVALYSDGDGDFRPKFEFENEYEYNKVEPSVFNRFIKIYDAG